MLLSLSLTALVFIDFHSDSFNFHRRKMNYVFNEVPVSSFLLAPNVVKIHTSSNAAFRWLSSFFCSIRGLETEVCGLLVRVCRELSDLGLQSHMAEDKENCPHGYDGPLCRFVYHHLHRDKHRIHGHGVSPHG